MLFVGFWTVVQIVFGQFVGQCSGQNFRQGFDQGLGEGDKPNTVYNNTPKENTFLKATPKDVKNLKKAIYKLLEKLKCG